MKKFFIFVILLLISVFPIYADNNNKDQLVKAMEYYELGDYHNTIKIYETLLDNGIANSTIYYNLALSYLRNRDIGKSKLNLERALKLTPRDKNIRNLNQYISEITEEPKQNFAEKFISDTKLMFSLNEITFIMFMLFLIVTVFVILYCIYYNKIYLNLSIIFFIIFLLLIPLFYIKIDDELTSVKAVIMNYTEVRNNPIKLEEPSFDMLEGRKVIVLSELGRWVNVKLEIEGLSGWIDRHYLEKI